MWKVPVPVLLLVCGSALLWAPAGEASTVLPEDDVTTPSSMVTPGVDDSTMTPATSRQSHKPADSTSQVPTNAKHTDIPIEDLPTTESTSHPPEGASSTTALNEASSHPRGKKPGHPNTDGFSTGTLIGIIAGALLGIGFIAVITIVAVRKMSGRYSP
uniref:Podoplanin n=1 Tax=Pipistrellus kuhlii TaxID=59472 RepID=A0A7J8AAY5_PIPKU|nr:podoplanin [Pipistrellus kuhlii]